MPLDAPFPLGPFLVDENGRLSPTEEGVFPAFALTWRGRNVRVWMARRDGNVGTLAFQMPVGRISSTAADAPSRSQPLRAAGFATVRALADLVPEGWRLTLQADHGVVIQAEMPMTMPASATDLITAVTRVMIGIGPYLDVLEEAGVERGTAKTWPG